MAVYAYLAVDLIDGGGGRVEGQKKVFGAPSDEIPNVVVFAEVLVLVAILEHRPAQERHGEGHGEVELDVVPCVVVSADEPAVDVGQR